MGYKKINRKIIKFKKEFNLPHYTNLLNNRAFATLMSLTGFKPSTKYFHNPFLMKGMEKSIKRIFKAISLNETIFILGDSDADGICSEHNL